MAARPQQAIHDVPADDDRGEKIFAAAALLFTHRQRDRHGGGARVAARREADVVELAPLAECRVDECGVQGRRFVAVIDDGAFAAPAHLGDVAIGDLVPLQSRTDQLDADLVENTVLGLLDRLRRDIFVAHLGCMDRRVVQ